MRKLSPAMIRTLREVKYWGNLVERYGKIYSRREDAPSPFCTKATVEALVERGWLRSWRSRYEITDAGKLAAYEFLY